MVRDLRKSALSSGQAATPSRVKGRAPGPTPPEAPPQAHVSGTRHRAVVPSNDPPWAAPPLSTTSRVAEIRYRRGIAALVAGLGVGGIAVALAAQNILGDLFASLSIVFDQPFAVGHFIVVGDMAGTVEHVGIKSTRIRSLSGELIVQSNASLLGARIHNYKHFYERRVLFSVGVTYDTPHEKLAAIPTMIRETVLAIEKTMMKSTHRRMVGKLLRYSDTYTGGVLPLLNTWMGTTARFSLRHWVGYFSLGFCEGK